MATLMKDGPSARRVLEHEQAIEGTGRAVLALVDVHVDGVVAPQVIHRIVLHTRFDGVTGVMAPEIDQLSMAGQIHNLGDPVLITATERDEQGIGVNNAAANPVIGREEST